MTSHAMSHLKTFALASIGVFIRLLTAKIFKDTLTRRVEVSTPINSWKRVSEAVYLWNSGLDPYQGNVFHEYPISLQFYRILVSYFNVDLAFAITDVATAILLQNSVRNQILLMGDKTEDIALKKSFNVLLTYLLLPINVISCAGTCTSIFTNFLVALISLLLPHKPFRVLTCVLCALLAGNNVHFATLIVPIFLCIEFCNHRSDRKSSLDRKEDVPRQPYYKHPDFQNSMTTSTAICLTSLITLMIASYYIMGGSWSFIGGTYMFVMKVQDLSPNIGMFWYFFTEMFDQFMDFFIWVVQINAFIHVVPISFHLRDNPFFALYVTLVTSSIFQSYASLSSVGLFLSMLPQWSDLVPNMRKILVTTCTACASMSLWPVFWHLWIVMGTANANFYFGATLAFTLALIVFVTDILSADGITKAKSKLELYKRQNPQEFEISAQD